MKTIAALPITARVYYYPGAKVPSMDVQLIEILFPAGVQLNRCLSLFIFFFGVIGNILNILVLNQKSLRSNPCVFLFFTSSVANLISILAGLIPRILSTWKLDVTETNDLLCKLRAFIMFTSRTVALDLIMLATVERWLVSAINFEWRQKSSITNAKRGSLVVTAISILLYVQMLICYQANLVNMPLKCYGKTRTCRLLTDIIYAGFTVLFPLITMAIFGIMTISNIRKTRFCMVPRKSSRRTILNDADLSLQARQRQRWRKVDRYLRRMLLLQVTSLILLTFPQAIHKIYFTLTSNKQKSQWEYDFDSFLYNFELLLPFVESALPFYIYTLAGGRVFRSALERLFFCSCRSE